MSKRKFFKPLMFGVVGISLVSLVVGLSINWSHMEYLQAVGSSGVKPFVEAFSTAYHKDHNKIDVAVEAGGTTFAIEQVAKGYAQIGNASNNPYWSIFPESGEQSELANMWESKKTITLGWEGVGIMYKVPSFLSDEAKQNFDIIITSKNIKDLYAVFSGFNESKLEDGQIELWDEEKAKERNSIYYYLSTASKKYFDEHPVEKQKIKDISIYPYLRSGGNTAANSSIAFTYYSNLAEFSDLTPRQQNAFRGGQYGHDHQFGETDEANSKAWDLMKTQDREGAMTYMSSGFFAYEGNIQQMNEHGYKVAGYLPSGADDETQTQYLVDNNGKFNVNNIAIKKTGYNWFRPINLMIDLNNQKAKDYVWWIFFGIDSHAATTFGELYPKIMAERGARSLTITQFNTMLSPNGEDTYEQLFDKDLATDFSLAKARSGDWSQVYGACEWGDE